MLTGQIQLLFAIYGLSFGFFTWLCEKAAGKIGRVQAGDGEATLRVVPKKTQKNKMPTGPTGPSQAGLFFALSGVMCLFLLAYLRPPPGWIRPIDQLSRR